MESLMSGAMLIEATMLSFLVALWITWMSLRGLFRMLPATRLNAVPVRPPSQRGIRAIGHHSA
jgi:hypothetical protein